MTIDHVKLMENGGVATVLSFGFHRFCSSRKITEKLCVISITAFSVGCFLKIIRSCN